MSASDVFMWGLVAFFIMALIGVGAVLMADFALWLYDEINDRRK